MNPYEEASLRAAALRGQGGATALASEMPGHGGRMGSYGGTSNVAPTSAASKGQNQLAQALMKLGKSRWDTRGISGGQGSTTLGNEGNIGYDLLGPEGSAGAPAQAPAETGNWFSRLFGGSSPAAEGGGGGGWSSLASFWPAGIVAAAVGNELSANKSNYNWTDEGGNEHKDPLRPNGWKDTFTGESAHYDAERRWVPWLNELTGGDKETGEPGWSEKYKINDLVQFGGDLGSPSRWDDLIKKGWGNLKDLF